MRQAIVMLAVAMAATAGVARAASVEVRDAVARVTVIPEDRRDIKVEVLHANPKLPLEVRGGVVDTVVDGGLRRRIRTCGRRDAAPSAWVSGVGRVEFADMPQIVIRTPRDVVISANGAVFGAIGRAGSVNLQDSGCDSWTIADVAGETRLRESGAGMVRMGSASHLDVHLSGAATVHAVNLRQGMQADLSGKGDVSVEDVSGPMGADISGLGHVRVAGGHASLLHTSVSGMGGVDFEGSADSLDASISGVGGVHVKQVTGQVRKSVSGLGRITVDQPRS